MEALMDKPWRVECRLKSHPAQDSGRTPAWPETIWLILYTTVT